jgi:phosphonoacetaldehyde hydrolase
VTERLTENTSSKRIQAVILDWAGTVIDYGCFAPMHAFMQTFEDAGVPITAREAREPMGMLKWDHIQAITQTDRVRHAWQAAYGAEPGKADIDRLYAGFEGTLMASLKEYTNPIPGALDTVRKLREAGIRIGSTTGYTRAMMDVIVPEALAKGYSPDCLVTPDETGAGRPSPNMIFRNLMTLGIFPPRTVVKVGDTVSDMQEGRNAGVWTVGVILGSSELGLTQSEVEEMPASELEERMNETRHVFEAAGADYVIASISQLPDVIDELERGVLEGALR